MIRRAVLVLLALAGGAASARAQGGGGAPVDLVLRGVPAAEALARLAEATGLSLVYPSDLVGEARVWCGGAGTTAEALLGCVARQAGLDYVRRSTGTYVLVRPTEAAPALGGLAGVVVDAATGAPLPFATVILADARTGAAADAAGLFAVGGLRAGPHRLVATYVGYWPAVETVEVAAGASVRRRIALRPRVVAARPVVVDALEPRLPSEGLGAAALAPGRFDDPGPAPSPDVVRAAAFALGVAARPLADGLSIQGGEAGEHPLALDGVPVYEPVALGRWLGALSPLAVGRVTLRKAGFGATHGSYTAGVVEAEHDVAPTPALTVAVDPLALHARAATRGQFGDGRTVAAMVAGRRGMWDAWRPPVFDRALRDWNAVDPVLAAVLAGAATDGLRYDAHRHGSDVGFSDVHAAARVGLDPYRTLAASAYHGRSAVATELFARGVDAAGGPDRLLVDRDRYRWTNTALRARADALVGARLVASGGLRYGRHALDHAFESLDAAAAGVPPGAPLGEAEAALRAALDAAPAAGDAHRVSEATADAALEWSAGPGRTLRLGAEATRAAHHLRLGSPTGATGGAPRTVLDHAAVGWRAAAVADARLALGLRATVEGGLRLTYLVAREQAYAEPRLALRYDALPADRLAGVPLGGLSLRLAGGLYRQFVNRLDLAVAGPSALVPSVALWLPVDASLPPPRAAHLAAEARWALAPGWAVAAEGFLKRQRGTLSLDYDALLGPGPLDDEAAFVRVGRGDARGVAARVERRGPRLAVELGGGLARVRRVFPGRFGDRAVSAPWEEPRRLTAALDWLPGGAAARGGALALRARLRAVWGRTWAFRRAYYDVLPAHATPGTFAPFTFDRPDADRLPPLVELDLGATYARPFGRARVEATAEVANALGRADALDWSLRRAPGGYEAVTRALPGVQPALRLRVSF